MQKLIFQTESMSQCHLKIQICMQKLLKIGRLLFLIISVCPNFLQLSIISSKKFGQTKIIKKSKLPFSDNFCMQKLNFQTESMSQCHLKIQICMQKLLKIGRLLFLIISVCPNFLKLSIFFFIVNAKLLAISFSVNEPDRS